jgi:hypothetical protein
VNWNRGIGRIGHFNENPIVKSTERTRE